MAQSLASAMHGTACHPHPPAPCLATPVRQVLLQLLRQVEQFVQPHAGIVVCHVPLLVHSGAAAQYKQGHSNTRMGCECSWSAPPVFAGGRRNPAKLTGACICKPTSQRQATVHSPHPHSAPLQDVAGLLVDVQLRQVEPLEAASPASAPSVRAAALCMTVQVLPAAGGATVVVVGG